MDVLARSGVDLAAMGLAWARAAPSVVLVPAFGLRALPAPARAVMGLAFAASVFPAVGPAASSASGPWLVLMLVELARGLPIALAAAVPLWAATMAGGVADALRGSQETLSVPTVEGRATPLGVPLSLLACAIFLATGGPARVVAALAFRPTPEHPLLAAADDIVGGIGLAVALGGPLLASSVVVELAAALVARAASPAQVHALLAPVRALGTIVIVTVVFERLATALAKAVELSP
ncbi:MAG TPA: flagellar biosynthetic protein FliR [Polyangiaceae bacterium]|nr:flagellar biosynthetic protein FliR [Polyangiaceae bacterium]